MNPSFLLTTLLAGVLMLLPEAAWAQDGLSVLDELVLDDLVEVEPPPGPWVSIGAPLALAVFMLVLMVLL